MSLVARRWWVAGLLLAFLVQGVTSMRRKSVTTDEIMYLTAGYYHLRTGAFDYNNTNPPLVKMWTALPLLALDPELPPVVGDPARWSEVEQWRYARAFLYDNRVDASRILFVGRLPVLLLALVLGLYVHRWSRELYGERAALLALGLFAFSPNLLAHARLATQDLALAAMAFAAGYHVWRYLEAPRWRPLLFAAAWFGAATASKTTAVLLIPPLLIALAVPLFRGRRVAEAGLPLGPLDRIRTPWRRRAATVALTWVLFGAASLAAVNLAYGFEGSFAAARRYDRAGAFAERVAAKVPPAAPVARAALRLPVPVPEPILRLAAFQADRVAQGNTVFFRGERSRQGWWYVIPVAFLIKTPLPTLLLAGAAVAGLLRRRSISTGEALLVGAALSVMAIFCWFKSVSIGLRYVLLVYPCLHVLASRVLREGIPLDAPRRWGVSVLAAWYLLGAAWTWPHYIPYFNEAIGGPSRGYRWLADSFVDWGQDLPGLRAYMDREGLTRIRLAYFGSGDARYHGIEYDYLPSVGLAPVRPGERWWFETGALPDAPFDPRGERIAISVTLYNGVFLGDYYAPLRELRPVDQVGHSILIFDPPER